MLSQESLYESGVMQRSGVEKFLSESLCFPKGHLMHYFRLLEKFLIAMPLGEEQLLVQCRYLLFKTHPDPLNVFYDP